MRKDTDTVLKVFTFFIQFLTLNANEMKLACSDEHGQTVDWYYLYKLPSSYDESDGLKYLYLTSSTYKTGWQLSNLLINDSTSFPANTLSSVFQDSEILSVAYNDESPNGKVNEIEGHTKGVVAADTVSGFWLIHSVPKYPTIETYTYPKSGTRYGQSFLCITINASQVNQIGEQLIFNEPNLYHVNIPNALKNLYSNFVNVSNKEWKQSGPFWNEASLTSVNGIHFQSFAKGRKFKKDLYEDWVAPKLNTDLLVETWRNGGGDLPSNCTRIKHVLNIAEIGMNEIKYTFKSTEDHSKWAVATENDWICVGDINRQEHQLQRGGGTVCQLNPIIAQAYRNLVKKFDPCSNFYSRISRN